MSKFICTIKLNKEIIIENVSAEVIVNDNGERKSWYGYVFSDIQIEPKSGQVYEIFLDDGRYGTIIFGTESISSTGNRIRDFKGSGALNQ